MSTVALTAFSVFRKVTNNDVEILCGASAVRTTDHGVTLEVTSVPLRDNIFPQFPRGSLALLYGFRDALDELSRQRLGARDRRAEFASLNIAVDVGDVVVGHVALDTLRKARFANVKRMTAELQDLILTRFARYAAAKSKSSSEYSAGATRLERLARHPELFDRLLATDSDFKNLDVLVIPTASLDAPDRIRQVALLRPQARILTCTQNAEHVSLELPGRFRNRAT